MIDWKQYTRQLTRFAVVGLTATLIHVVVFSVLVNQAGFAPLLANLVGFGAAFCLSFSAHSRWTFSTVASGAAAGGAASEGRTEFVKFLLTALSGLIVNSAIVFVTMTLLKLPSIYPSILMVTATPVFLYLMNRFWVFSNRFGERPAGENGIGGTRRDLRLLRAGLILAGICVLALLPAFMPGEFAKGGDARFHLVWQNALVAWMEPDGVYPRWLPGMNDGFGSPVFFIYPPLSHLLAAAFAILPPLADAPETRLVLATLVGFVIGAIGVYAWMRERGLRGGAFAAAVFYTLAPYHLFVDAYYRSAFAETFAFAWAPWIFYAIGRMPSRTPNALAVLALSCAFLFTTHLPSSLGVMAAAGLYALILYAPKRDFGPLALCAFGVLCGALTAGGYLGTALTQTAFINADALFGGRSESWRWLIGWNVWSDTGTQKLIVVVAAFQALVFAAALWLGRSGLRRSPLALFCVVAGGVSLLMITVLAEPIWRLETPLNRIQFPWRLLFVQTLAASAMVGIAAERLERRTLAFATLAAACVVANAGLLAYRDLVVRPTPLPQSEWGRYDAPEYRLGDIDKLAMLFPGSQKAALVDGSGTVTVDEWTPRRIVLGLDLSQPATILVRQFNYTGWRYVFDGQNGAAGTTAGADKGDVVRFAVPRSGVSRVTIELVPTVGERLGWWCSGAGLLLLAGFQLAMLARRRRTATMVEDANRSAFRTG